MQRIHFTTQDLANITVASRPWPMVEVIFALQRLQGDEAGMLFGGWRRDVNVAIGRFDRGQEMLHRLFDLVPRHGYIPDFFATVVGGRDDVDAWIEHVVAAPRARVWSDLREGARYGRPLGGWLDSFANGDRESRSTLGQAMRSFHSAAIEPRWSPLVAAVEAERASRARDLLDGGLGKLLGGLPGVARWEPPTLTTACPIEMDFRLDGRGLVLVPSFFCWASPVMLVDPELTPVLAYPVQHHHAFCDPAGDTSTQLAAVLGRTRAAVLEVIAGGATTSELSRRLAISPAAASWHVSALRQAGLIVTVRSRHAVHTLTPRGEQLLH